MSSDRKKLVVSEIGGDVDTGLTRNLENPLERVKLAIQLTAASWAIRKAKGDRVPEGLERVFRITEF